MRKLDFWKSDWFPGVVVALVLAVAANGDLIQGLERKAYDLGVQLASRTPSGRIAVIAIDERSISDIGRWPWSHDIHAKMTDILATAGAKVIANTTFFFEPQTGLDNINKPLHPYAKSTPQWSPEAVVAAPDALLQEATQAPSADLKLAAAFRRAGNVVSPMVFQALTGQPDNGGKPLPGYVAANGLAFSAQDNKFLPPQGINPLYPIAELGGNTGGIGHLNAVSDIDGAVRSEALLVGYGDKFFPALSVVIAAKSLNLKPADIKPVPGEGLQIGKLRVRTGPELQMYPFFYSERGRKPAFAVDSFSAVYSGKVPAAKYEGKIVLIGAISADLSMAQVTPVSAATPRVMTLAHTVSSILAGHYFTVPGWGRWVGKGVFVLVAVYLIVLLPRLGAAVAGILSLIIGLGLIAAHFVLMATQLLWIQLMAALLLLATGHAALISKRFLTARGEEQSDIERRLGHAMAMADTVILGAGGGRPGGAVTLPVSGVEKPMLGRYQIEKELGKGAMGTVYLGKDSRNGRVVAIKTMALSQECEPDELKEVKERFLREAETAGRLAHAHIVTIFDAGEEHELAYIAMEFLRGGDLTPHTKPGNLLPLPKVLSIVARVAEALGYAHSHNVVHRDIKPANIMHESDGDTVKVTDFGIARITDSSKTRTGMVLGTPSYMSPEQLSGRKIDGRSDLFSLGVTLYQLCCGHLPFQGSSMAQLMFRIANEPHAEILVHHPELPPCVVEVINRALAKQPETRYQTGDEMARVLHACIPHVAQSQPEPVGSISGRALS